MVLVGLLFGLCWWFWGGGFCLVSGFGGGGVTFYYFSKLKQLNDKTAFQINF